LRMGASLQQWSPEQELSRKCSLIYIYSETCIRRNLNKAEICSMWTNSIVPARRISIIYFV
jgi:hypothetical protein